MWCGSTFICPQFLECVYKHMTYVLVNFNTFIHFMCYNMFIYCDFQFTVAVGVVIPPVPPVCSACLGKVSDLNLVPTLKGHYLLK